MYPQQQHHHQQYQAQPYNFQQQQQQHQPYYSSFPDPSLHPPGTDPLANSTSFAPPVSIYTSQPTDYQNWIVPQSEPIRYDLAVGSSHEASAAPASLPSVWNGTWPPQIYGNETTTMLPNQTKVTIALRCEVCKVDVNSKDSYDSHIAGKKHKKNLQIQTNPTIASHANVQTDTSSIQGQALIGPVAKQSEPKKQVDSATVCSTCNVLCTSQDAYIKHLAGRKHAAQVALMSNDGIGPSIAEFKGNGVGPFQKAAKKIKVAQSVWCEVCKINCNSRDIYITHLAGKKHLKTLEKQSNPKIDVGTSGTSTATTTAIAPNTLIGPQEKPGTDQPKPKKASELDIETKKRKVVEGGAAVDGIKMCTLCNVVCNSQTVFNFHLVGQKHAAMVKKAGSVTG